MNWSKKQTVKQLVIVILVMAGNSVFAQEYVLDENWPQPLPDGIEWGQVPNVTIDQDGNIYAFHRADPPVLKFDPAGKLINSWGSGQIALPHGFRAQPDGTLLGTDYNRQNGHIVVRYDTDGNLLQRLGTRGFSGTLPNTFNGPADAVIGRNGDIFVADGHWNNRIVKFDKAGRYLMEWGHKGTGPGEFDLPHTIVIDRRGRVLVGDRGNHRIQIFDQSGNYITEWDQFGWPSGMFIDGNDVLYVADYQNKRGVTYGSAEDGMIMGFIAGSEPEGVVVDAQGNVYTGEVTGGEGGDGKIIRKFIKQ
ncbi:MAG: 6-bladed beta-propeller [Gammaproteobacteria bacterium]|nr:6-bladed beta-propeller [Gammaproteobacteria bacterium]